MSNEAGCSRGVGVFRDMGQLHRNHPPPNFNMCQPPTNNRPSTSIWGTAPTGYASPPGTDSSGSSANSQSCGKTPEHAGVNSIITNLLKVVNSDTFVPTSDVKIAATDALGLSLCGHDCMDPLCESCIGIRQNRPCTNNLLDHFRSISNGTLDGLSPPMLHQGSSSMSPTFMCHQLYCEIHRDAPRLWCQTCNQTLCAECSMHHHRGHVTVHIMEAVEVAGAQASQIMNEAQLGITSLREDLDAVQVAAESLEHKSRDATADVTACIRRVASALDAREKELISRIETVKALKFSALKARSEGLRDGLTRLSTAIDKLNKAMNAATIAGHPLDLLVTKDMASGEVFHVRQSRLNLPPAEENWISLTAPEGNVLLAIANLGSIMVNNPGPIGDRRALRGRGGPQQSPLRQSHIAGPFGPVPRGRPVSSNSFPVIVRIGRNSLSSAPKPITIFGNDGEARDNICRPWGVACDKEGHVVVADRSNNRIQIYREDGTFVRRFGMHGTAPGQFDRPAGVAIDGRRRIVVADKDNHRIQILTMEGLFLLAFGEKGGCAGQFNYPWDVAVNNECQIVVSDTRNHRIQLFSAEGIFLRKYGYETAPSMWKHFDSPRGVAFNPEGSVVTTDFNNHRVIVIDADFLNAKVLGCDSSTGTKQFLRPQGLVIDDEGNIIIADSRNHRIQVFDSAGTLKWKFGSYGKGPDEMDRPSGIALSPSGRIAVVDFGNNRVLII